MPGRGDIVWIVGTDTGVGKTLVGCSLTRLLKARGFRVIAIKPVESGCGSETPGPLEDGVQLAAAAGQAAPRSALQRLRAPLAAPLAAELEAVPLDSTAWLEAIERAAALADVVLVEGAGGLLSPLTFDETALDLLRQTGGRALLVAADRLGTLSHTLLAARAMDAAELLGVVLSAPAVPDDSSGRNADMLLRLGLERVHQIPRLESPADVDRALSKVADWIAPTASEGDRNHFGAWIEATMAGLARAGRLRSLQDLTPDGASAVRASLHGRPLVLFSTNDYLGLSVHRAVREAVARAACDFGQGPRGSPLVCGMTSLHRELAERLASAVGQERALLFPTGFAANLGTITALADRGTTFFSDALNHASIVDACRLARLRGATVEVYRHADPDHLESLLKRSPARRKIVLSESVFSTQGDLAPLAILADLKDRYGAYLLVDEGHGFLVFGERGGGLSEPLAGRIDVYVGTLSKAAAGQGGFAATRAALHDLLLNRSRPNTYSTASPVPVVAGLLAALEIAACPNALRETLRTNVSTVARALGLVDHQSPIIPWILGPEEAALESSRTLFDQGLHVMALRPPTVPPGTSRLRISLSAAHSESDLKQLVDALLSGQQAGWRQL